MSVCLQAFDANDLAEIKGRALDIFGSPAAFNFAMAVVRSAVLSRHADQHPVRRARPARRCRPSPPRGPRPSRAPSPARALRRQPPAAKRDPGPHAAARAGPGPHCARRGARSRCPPP